MKVSGILKTLESLCNEFIYFFILPFAIFVQSERIDGKFCFNEVMGMMGLLVLLFLTAVSSPTKSASSWFEWPRECRITVGFIPATLADRKALATFCPVELQRSRHCKLFRCYSREGHAAVNKVLEGSDSRVWCVASSL